MTASGNLPASAKLRALPPPRNSLQNTAGPQRNNINGKPKYSIFADPAGEQQGGPATSVSTRPAQMFPYPCAYEQGHGQNDLEGKGCEFTEGHGLGVSRSAAGRAAPGITKTLASRQSGHRRTSLRCACRNSFPPIRAGDRHPACGPSCWEHPRAPKSRCAPQCAPASRHSAPPR